MNDKQRYINSMMKIINNRFGYFNNGTLKYRIFPRMIDNYRVECDVFIESKGTDKLAGTYRHHIRYDAYIENKVLAKVHRNTNAKSRIFVTSSCENAVNLIIRGYTLGFKSKKSEKYKE